MQKPPGKMVAAFSPDITKGNRKRRGEKKGEGGGKGSRGDGGEELMAWDWFVLFHHILKVDKQKGGGEEGQGAEEKKPGGWVSRRP